MTNDTRRPARRFHRAAVTLAAAAWAMPAVAMAGDTAPSPRADGSADQRYAVHAQSTLVVQGVGGFASPTAGPNSLTPHQTKETVDATLFAGVRPWRGAEIWLSPEVDQGFGLSDTLGVAGFPSAEAYKVGKSNPYVRLQRAFVRQTIALGGDVANVDPGAMTLGGTTRANRLVLTLGKFGVTDVFDTNRFAHDARNDFLNWSLVDTGTFDYAADAWGYSYGAAAELVVGSWTLRAGLFNLSTVPNGEKLETGFGQNQVDVEVEHRHHLLGGDGAIRVTAFRSRGRFARYDEALALANGGPVDLGPARRRMSRMGLAANLEQAIGAHAGVFARAGFSDGNVEVYDFTDIDRTLALGGSIDGSAWGRKADRFALAFVANGISAAHRAYLAAGGLGVLVGDGSLVHPGAEHIIETYYAFKPVGPITLTFDFQHIAHPGYNRDRGPANVLAVRLHGEI